MWNRFSIILLFVPANLTEICQPLGIYFNAEFKVRLAQLRNERIANEFEGGRKRISLNEVSPLKLTTLWQGINCGFIKILLQQ